MTAAYTTPESAAAEYGVTADEMAALIETGALPLYRTRRDGVIVVRREDVERLRERRS